MRFYNVFLIIVFIILFSINLVYSLDIMNSTEVDSKGNINIPQNLDDTSKKNIEVLANYAKKYFPSENGGPRATIKIDENGLIIIKPTSKDEEWKIPKGYSLSFTSEGLIAEGKPDKISLNNIGTNIDSSNLVLGGLTVDASGEIPISRKLILSRNEKNEKTLTLIATGGQISVNSQYFSGVIEKGSELKLYGEGTNRIYELNGMGDLIVNGNFMKGIKDALIKLGEDKEIYYAKFISPKGGNYNLKYKEKSYNFILQSNGEAEIDFLNKKINGKSLILNLDDDYQTIRSFKGFGAILDDKGKIIQAKLSEGDSFQLYDKSFSSIKGDFIVNFDGKDISKESLPSISISGDKVNMKGLVKISGLYEGLDKNSYSSFNFNDIRTGGNFIDVISGNAFIFNNKYKVLVKDGDAFVKADSQSMLQGGLGFSYKSKDGELVEGLFSGYSQETKYSLKVTRSDGKVDEFLVPISIGNFASSFQTINLQNDINNIQKQIDSLNDDGLSKERDKLELQKISKQSNLDIVLGRGVDNSIIETKAYLENSNLNSESKRTAETLLGDLLTQQAQSALPRYYSFTGSQEFNEVQGVGYAAHSAWVTRNQKIDFEVDTSGNVKAYIFDGKRIEINGLDTELLDGLYTSNKNLISELMKDPSINSLSQGFSSKMIIGKEVLSSSEYEVTQKTAEEARKNYESAIKNARESGNFELVADLEMKIAGTYLSERKNELATNEYQKLGNGEYSSEITAKAKMMLSTIKFQENPIENAVEIKRLIQEAIDLNPTDLDLKFAKSKLDQYYLGEYRSTTFKESQRSYIETMGQLGEGDGLWQTTKDILDVIGRPATNVYLASYKGEKFVEQMKANMDLALSRVDAIDQLTLLSQKGVDLSIYTQSSNLQKFMTLYDANNYLDTISSSELQRYMVAAGVNPSNPDSLNNMDKLRDLIVKDYGEFIATRFSVRASETLKRLVLVDDGISNDPTLYMIATNNGNSDLKYTGTTDLSKAYSMDRVAGANAVKFGTAENIILGFGDVALNPMSYLGVSAAAQAGNLGKFLTLNVGISSTLNSAITGVSEYNPSLATVLTAVAIGHGFSIGNFEKNFETAKRISALSDGTHFIQVTDHELSNIDSFAKTIGTLDKEAQTITLGDGRIVKYSIELPKGESVATAGAEAIVGSERTSLIKSSEAKMSGEIEGASDGLVNAEGNIERALEEARAAEKADLALAAASDAKAPGCFLAGTKIMLSNGNYKNIEDIKTGDNVKAFDLINNKVVDADVTTTFVRKANSYRIIEYEIIDY